MCVTRDTFDLSHIASVQACARETSRFANVRAARMTGQDAARGPRGIKQTLCVCVCVCVASWLRAKRGGGVMD